MHSAWLVAEHTPHVPFGSQAGAAACPEQPASLTHVEQVCVPVLQVGVLGLVQSVFVTQATQAGAAEVSQTGVALAHMTVFVAEHRPQLPFDSHAGVPP